MIAVRNGTFDPDATRAGAFRKQAAETFELVVDDEGEEAVDDPYAVPTGFPYDPTSPAGNESDGFGDTSYNSMNGEGMDAEQNVAELSDDNNRSDTVVPEEYISDEGDDVSDGPDLLVTSDDDALREGLERALAVVAVPALVHENCKEVPLKWVWAHITRNTLHLHQKSIGRTEDKLICHRSGLNKTYRKLDAVQAGGAQRCCTCFRVWDKEKVAED